FGFADAGKGSGFDVAGESDVLEGVIGFEPIVEFSDRGIRARVGFAGLGVPDDDELLGVRVGKWTVEGGVEDAENGGSGANAESEREDYHGEEAGAFAEIAQGELKVLAKTLKEMGHGSP